MPIKCRLTVRLDVEPPKYLHPWLFHKFCISEVLQLGLGLVLGLVFTANFIIITPPILPKSILKSGKIKR